MHTQIPLISVVIPAYNHEKYVDETIRSIIAQDYSPIELLIIDDGSKDRTWSIINSLKEICEKRFTRTVFLTQENAGTCTTLNRLFSMAKGDFISLIASDDTMKPHALSRLCMFLVEHPDYVLAVGDNELIDSDSKRIFWDKNNNFTFEESEAIFHTFAELLQNKKKIDFNSSIFGRYSSLYCGNYIPNGYLIRRSAFLKIHPFTSEAPLEDWFLMLQLAKHGKMKFLPEILFSYRMHATNTIKNTEHMLRISQETKAYEDKLLLSLPMSSLPEDVQEVCRHGAVYKSGGIKHLFEWRKRKGPRGKILEIIFRSVFTISFKRG